MPSAAPSLSQVRVVVRLPWNRPEQPPSDPPHIDWTAEKADILWKVIERSRTSDNGGADWKGLAAHLQVPLPYLLYRVHTRFQEELRGLQDIPGILSPTSSTVAAPNTRSEPVPGPASITKSPQAHIRHLGRASDLSGSARTSTPTGIRARLTSIGSSYSRRVTSSTVTVQQRPAPQRRQSSSPEGSDSEEDNLKEEDAERQAEEQDALDRKLRELQFMITNEALGLVSSGNKKGKTAVRGRNGLASPSSDIDSRRDTLSSSTSQSLSSTSSPQGSIPEIPSPSSDAQPRSPMRRHLSPHKSSSPPALSPRSATGQWYGSLRKPLSDQGSGSNQGSQASSFSDISDASLSGSALESALMSNINGSRLSAITRSRFGGANRTRAVIQ